MKFDGANWVYVGDEGFSFGVAEFQSLAFNPVDSLPYVAFEDAGYSWKVREMKFNGAAWVDVGNAGFQQVGIGVQALHSVRLTASHM